MAACAIPSLNWGNLRQILPQNPRGHLQMLYDFHLVGLFQGGVNGSTARLGIFIVQTHPVL